MTVAPVQIPDIARAVNGSDRKAKNVTVALRSKSYHVCVALPSSLQYMYVASAASCSKDVQPLQGKACIWLPDIVFTTSTY